VSPNNAVSIPENRRSVLIDLSARYGMEPAAFEATLRATVVPEKCSREQLAAFLLVAKEYDLNPLTKEIYAFPSRAGGIQPIVSIDGWCNIINSHPKLNGIEFDDHVAPDGSVSSITARIWRKDRDKPIVVTEYMAECARQTDPWRTYPRRMLRHKALIQCARYAFSLAGIVDPDEAERLGVDVSPTRDVTPPKKPPIPDVPVIEASVAHDADGVVWEEDNERPATKEDTEETDIERLSRLDSDLAAEALKGTVHLGAYWKTISPSDQRALKAALDRRHKPTAAEADKALLDIPPALDRRPKADNSEPNVRSSDTPASNDRE